MSLYKLKCGHKEDLWVFSLRFRNPKVAYCHKCGKTRNVMERI